MISNENKQIIQIPENEYNALKKDRNKIRLIGVILLIVGLFSYVFLIRLEQPFLILPAGIVLFIGVGLTVRSFIHPKYAILKAAKTKKSMHF